MKILAADAGKAEMVAVPQSPGGLENSLQAFEVVLVQRIDAADGKVHPVRDHRPAAGAELQDRLRKPAEIHEVFRNDLQPTHRQVGALQLVEMLFAQADARAEGGEG